MKKALLCVLAFLAFALANEGLEKEFKTSDFMLKKAIIKGDDVNLRMLPRISSTTLDAVFMDDEVIVESVPIFDEESGLYWLKIVNNNVPLFIAEKFVELKELNESEKESLKNQKLFTGVKIAKPSGKKYGNWRDFAEIYPYKLGGNIHDMAKIWGNGTLKRMCLKPDAMCDGCIQYCVNSEFKADGVMMYFQELDPEIPSQEIIYHTTTKISKKGYEIAGVVVGKTTKDEALKLYGKACDQYEIDLNDEGTKKGVSLIYPNMFDDTDKGGCENVSREGLAHSNFALVFDEKSEILEFIKIENLPWD